MTLRVGAALAVLAVAYAPSPAPKPKAGGATGAAGANDAGASQRAWWLPPPAVFPGAAPFAMGSAPMAVPSAAFGGVYAAPPVATGAQAYNSYLAYYSRLAGTAGANAAYGAGGAGAAAYAGYPYYGYGSAFGYPSAPAAAVPGVPGGATNVYSMYPSSYYRFRQQQAGAGAADEAAAGLPRFAQRGGEMAGAEAEADAAADVHASEAAMLAAAHGRRAAHWSQWAGAGAPEGGDAAAAQLGADAAGGASSAAAAAAAHMMAPLPPGLMPSSAYSPGQRAARLAAMRAELDQRMIALKALHEKRVAAAAAAAKAGSGAPAGAAAAAEAAADAAEEERLAREIDAAMAMPAELEGAGMPPMPAAPGQAQEKAQETAQGKGQAPAASSRGFVRPRIVQHMPAHA